MNVRAIKPTCSSSNYQNNKDWALSNKDRGKYAAISEACSIGLALAQSCTEEDSTLHKTLDFSKKCFDAGRNYEQYSLYFREDDDVGKDSIEKPLAGNIGKAACFVERKVNPILIPLSFLFGENAKEAYISIANLFNSIYWRARLCFEKIQWKLFKVIPSQCMKLFDKKLDKQKEGCDFIKDLLMPFLGWIGVVSTGIFTPLKSFSKLAGNNSKILNSLASVGYMTQNVYYFFKFTLPEYFDIKSKKSNNSKLLFSLGFVSNITNALSPLFELIPHNKLRNLLVETAQGLNRLFFSIRRNKLGNNWLKVNPYL